VSIIVGVTDKSKQQRLAYRNDNDNDKRLGLTAKADQPDHKKYSTLKIKIVYSPVS